MQKKTILSKLTTLYYILFQSGEASALLYGLWSAGLWSPKTPPKGGKGLLALECLLPVPNGTGIPLPKCTLSLSPAASSAVLARPRVRKYDQMDEIDQWDEVGSGVQGEGLPARAQGGRGLDPQGLRGSKGVKWEAYMVLGGQRDRPTGSRGSSGRPTGSQDATGRFDGSFYAYIQGGFFDWSALKND